MSFPLRSLVVLLVVQVTGWAQVQASLPLASVPSGPCEEPFHLTLAATPTASNAAIRYTLDGSLPSETNGMLYEQPILIGTTSIVRASIEAPASIVNTLTLSYLFEDQIVSALDPRAFPEPETTQASLRALPWLSVVADPLALFGPEGIYTNPDRRGMTAEIPVSVEWLNDASGTFRTQAGLRVHGGAARQHRKRPLRLHFRSLYGDAKLDYPLFPASLASRFDSLVLRSGGQDAWTEPQRAEVGSLAYHATYLRDAFVRRTEHAMGLITPHGRFMHLFLNAGYWGVYNLQERPTASYFSEKLGGLEEDWDVIRAGGPILSGRQRVDIVAGDDSAWRALQDLGDPAISPEQAFTDAQALLDSDAFCDALISRMWAGDHDWLGPASFMGITLLPQSRNWYAGRHSRAAAPGPFHFLAWDAEISLGNNLFPASINPKRTLTLNLTKIDSFDSPAYPYSRLRLSNAFQRRFADRVNALLGAGGVLSIAKTSARWQGLMEELRLPLHAEAGAWGDTHPETFLSVQDPWESEVAWVGETFLAQRSAIFLDQCRATGLYPNIDAPQIDFDAATQWLTLSATGDTILFTVDGSEPAEAGMPYEAPFLLTEDTEIRARAQSNEGTFSALTARRILVKTIPATANTITVSEFFPSPLQDATLPDFDRNAFEFIELENLTDTPLQLEGLRFTHGIDFTFPKAILPARDRLVLAKDPQALQTRHPELTSVFGPYEGRIANEGERLRLEDRQGQLVFHLNFHPTLWPGLNDYSLVARRTLVNPRLIDWRLSLKPHGTPGSSDRLAYSGGDLLAYALGDDANNPLEIIQTPQTIGDTIMTTLQARLVRRATADDVEILFEESADLIQWTRSRHWHFIEQTQAGPTEHQEIYHRQHPASSGTGERHFRMRVSPISMNQ